MYFTQTDTWIVVCNLIETKTELSVFTSSFIFLKLINYKIAYILNCSGHIKNKIKILKFKQIRQKMKAFHGLRIH